MAWVEPFCQKRFGKKKAPDKKNKEQRDGNHQYFGVCEAKRILLRQIFLVADNELIAVGESVGKRSFRFQQMKILAKVGNWGNCDGVLLDFAVGRLDWRLGGGKKG